MSRSFTPTTDKITLALGGLGFAPPVTIVAIVKKAADGTQRAIFHGGTDAGSARWGLSVNASNQLVLRISGNLLINTGVTLTVADGWALVGGSKATGTVAARLHTYKYGTATSTHLDSAGTSGAGTPTTSAFIGGTATAGSEPWSGLIALVGVWNVVLTDAQVDSLIYGIDAWKAVSGLVALLPLNQLSTATGVTDLVGTSTQSAISGTTVSTDNPPFWYGPGGDGAVFGQIGMDWTDRTHDGIVVPPWYQQPDDAGDIPRQTVAAPSITVAQEAALWPEQPAAWSDGTPWVLPGEDSAFKPVTVRAGATPVVTTSTKWYERAVFADGPMGFWRMGDAAGHIQDSSGHNHPSTVIDGLSVYSQTPPLPLDPTTSILFSGTSAFEIPPDTDFDFGDRFTLEAWIKPGAAGAARAIISKNTGGYYLRLNTTNGLNLLASGVTDIVSSTIAVPSDGLFHHVVATKDGSAVALYIDGVDVTGAVTNATIVNTANNLCIGTDRGGEDANGTIGDVAVYWQALSPARVLAHYLAGALSPAQVIVIVDPNAPPTPWDDKAPWEDASAFDVEGFPPRASVVFNPSVGFPWQDDLFAVDTTQVWPSGDAPVEGFAPPAAPAAIPPAAPLAEQPIFPEAPYVPAPDEYAGPSTLVTPPAAATTAQLAGLWPFEAPPDTTQTWLSGPASAEGLAPPSAPAVATTAQLAGVWPFETPPAPDQVWFAPEGAFATPFIPPVTGPSAAQLAGALQADAPWQATTVTWFAPETYSAAPFTPVAVVVTGGSAPKGLTGAVEYVVELFDSGGTFGPNTKLGEIWDARNIGWSRYDRLPGKAFMTLYQDSRQLTKISPLITHMRITRVTPSGDTEVYNGQIIDYDSTGDDVVVEAFDYVALFAISRSGYRTLYPTKLLGTEIAQIEAQSAISAVFSPLGFIAVGTVENPLGQDGVTAIKTNTQFGLLDQMRLQLLYDLSEMGRANTTNHVTFDVTRTAPFQFRFFKNRGTAQNIGMTLNGSVTDYQYLPNWGAYRNDLASLGTTVGGGAVEIVKTYEAGAASRGRRQDVATIKTLLGITTSAVEADQQQAATARMLNVATQKMPALSVRLERGYLAPFAGWDICDTVPVEIVNGIDNLTTRQRIAGVRALYTESGEDLALILEPIVT